MTGLHDFLTMGGYGFYVWAAYGAAAVVVIGLGLISRQRLARLTATLARIEAERGGRR